MFCIYLFSNLHTIHKLTPVRCHRSPDDIAPPLADEPTATKSTMEYAEPQQRQQQQEGDVDYRVPFCDSPVPVQCPACGQRTVSKTRNVSGGYT